MSTDLEVLLGEAAEAGDQGEWEHAHQLLTAGLGNFPEHPALLCALGVAARHLGADGAAYEYFRRCVAQEPEDPTLLATAGAGLAAFDDPDAERVLRLAALSAPDSAHARIAYGAYLAREGMTGAAIQELETARALGGEQAGEAGRELAVAFLSAGRPADALPLLEDNAGDAWLEKLRALALLEAGEPTEAAELLHELSEADPGDVELQLLAALACAAEDWNDAAWSALARAELAASEEERPLLLEVEERIEAGPEEARELLTDDLAPSFLREWLVEAR
jgi:predicted Zn-dependent protease